ncbi:MAG: hypothetical protein H6812_13165 [Phycisphaeraceae bacterium]|nr:hypothetical protein [Phycisphaerales bacterium]MCB9844187.1 hypothetical protein [Phycisphaeraceae bacterium]
MSDERGFYVGYLEAPPAHARFVKRAILVLMWLCVVGAGVSAWAMRHPGEAVWDTSTPRMFEGVLRESPYPMLETEEGVYLIVRIGKFGAQDRVAGLADRWVRLEGYLLERDGRRMIELLDDAGAIDEVSGTPAGSEDRQDFGEVSLRGEIVDSKCYLGAMKPGDGKGHKPCATLCVGNGIPPMLVVHHDGGGKDYYILATDAFGAANEMVREYLGEAVEVRGRVVERGGVRFVRALGIERR